MARYKLKDPAQVVEEAQALDNTRDETGTSPRERALDAYARFRDRYRQQVGDPLAGRTEPVDIPDLPRKESGEADLPWTPKQYVAEAGLLASKGLRAIQRPFEEAGEAVGEYVETRATPYVGESGGKVAGILAGGAVQYAPTLPLLAQLGPARAVPYAQRAALKYGPRAAAALQRALRTGKLFGAYEAATEGARQTVGEAPVDLQQQALHGGAGFVGGTVGHAVLGEALPFVARPAFRGARGALGRVFARKQPAPLAEPPTPVVEPAVEQIAEVVATPKEMPPSFGGPAEGVPAPAPGRPPAVSPDSGLIESVQGVPPRVTRGPGPRWDVATQEIPPGRPRRGPRPTKTPTLEESGLIGSAQKGSGDSAGLIPSKQPPDIPAVEGEISPAVTGMMRESLSRTATVGEVPPTVEGEIPPAVTGMMRESLSRTAAAGEVPPSAQAIARAMRGPEDIPAGWALTVQPQGPIPPGRALVPRGKAMALPPELETGGGLQGPAGRRYERGLFERLLSEESPIPPERALVPRGRTIALPPEAEVGGGLQGPAGRKYERELLERLLGPAPPGRPFEPPRLRAQAAVAVRGAPTRTPEAPRAPSKPLEEPTPTPTPEVPAPAPPKPARAEGLTFEQFFLSKKGYWDPQKAARDPEYAALRQEYTGQYAPEPTTQADSYRQAIADNMYIARTGKNRLGEKLPPQAKAEHARFARELQDRLNRLLRTEREMGQKGLPPPPPRGDGSSSSKPLFDKLERRPQPGAVPAEQSFEAAAGKALGEKDAQVVWGKVISPSGEASEAAWVEKPGAIWDPQHNQWMTPEFWRRYHASLGTRTWSKAELDAFQKQTGRLPSPESLAAAEQGARRGVVGEKVDVGFPGQKGQVEAQWEVVPADMPIASNQPGTLKPTPGYLAELQRRARERVSSREQLDYLKSEFDPTQLGESRTGDIGAPVIGPDNMVESGNLRVTALREIAGTEQGNAYTAWLRANSERFGIPSSAVESIISQGQFPILVRRRLGVVPLRERAAMAETWNVPTTARMGAAEVAMTDAARMTPELLEMLQPAASGDPLMSSGNSPFLLKFIEQVVPHAERGAVRDATGQLSDEGIRRIRNAVVAYTYGGKDLGRQVLLRRIAESVHNDVKNITNALVQSAPRYARLKAEAHSGKAYESIDISEELARSASTYAELKNKGTAIGDWLAHEDMFNPVPGERKLLVELFDKHRRSAKALSEVLNEYARVAERQIDPRQGNLFGTPEAPNRGHMLRAAIHLRENGSLPVRDQVEGAVEAVAKEGFENSQILGLRAQLRAAEASGKFEEAATLRAEIAMLESGHPPRRGGAGATREDIEANIDKMLKDSGYDSKDGAIYKKTLVDMPRWAAFLNSPDFATRRNILGYGIVRLYQKAMQEVPRYKRIFLNGKAGPKTPKQQDGFLTAMARVPRKDRTGLNRAFLEADAREAVFSRDELVKEFGLGEAAIKAYERTNELFNYALRLVINPMRRTQGKKPLEPRKGYLPHKWMGRWELYDATNMRPIITPKGATFDTENQAIAAAYEVLKLAPDQKFVLKPTFWVRAAMEQFPDSVDARVLAGMFKTLENKLNISSETLAAARAAGIRPRGFWVHTKPRMGAPGYEEHMIPAVIERYFAQLSRTIPLNKARDSARVLQLRIDPTTEPNRYAVIDRFMKDMHGGQTSAELVFDDIINRAARHVPGLQRIPLIGKHIGPGMRPTKAATRTLRAATAQAKLGMLNMGFGLMNLSQFATHAAPVLGPRYVEKAIRMALKARANPNSPEGMLVRRFEKLGWIEPAFLRGEVPGYGDKASHFLYFFGSHAEQMNRKLTLLGAFSRLVERGAKGFSKAEMAELPKLRARYEELNALFAQQKLPKGGRREMLTLAEQIGDRSFQETLEQMGLKIMGGEKPERLVQLATELAEGIMPKLQRKIVMAHSQRVNEFVNFGYDPSYRGQAFRGPFGELVGQFKSFSIQTGQYWKRLADVKAYPSLAAHGGITLALAGGLGFPFWRFIDNAAGFLNEMATGDKRSPTDFLVEAQVPQWVLRGSPALLGIDVSSRLGYGDIVPEDLWDLAGASVNTVADAAQSIWKQDYDMLMRQVATAPGHWWAAWKNEQEGYARERRSGQRMRYIPAEGENLVRLFGFRPLTEARLSDELRLSKRKEATMRQDKQSYVARAVDIIKTSAGQLRADELKALFAEMREEHPEIQITQRDLETAIKAEAIPMPLRRLKTMPKALRPEWVERNRELIEEQARKAKEREALKRMLR